MNTAAQIAIVLGMLALIAGGSLIAWICLFYFAVKSERTEADATGPSPTVGGHA